MISLGLRRRWGLDPRPFYIHFCLLLNAFKGLTITLNWLKIKTQTNAMVQYLPWEPDWMGVLRLLWLRLNNKCMCRLWCNSILEFSNPCLHCQDKIKNRPTFKLRPLQVLKSLILSSLQTVIYQVTPWLSIDLTNFQFQKYWSLLRSKIPEWKDEEKKVTIKMFFAVLPAEKSWFGPKLFWLFLCNWGMLTSENDDSSWWMVGRCEQCWFQHSNNVSFLL